MGLIVRSGIGWKQRFFFNDEFGYVDRNGYYHKFMNARFCLIIDSKGYIIFNRAELADVN